MTSLKITISFKESFLQKLSIKLAAKLDETFKKNKNMCNKIFEE